MSLSDRQRETRLRVWLTGLRALLSLCFWVRPRLPPSPGGKHSRALPHPVPFQPCQPACLVPERRYTRWEERPPWICLRVGEKRAARLFYLLQSKLYRVRLGFKGEQGCRCHFYFSHFPVPKWLALYLCILSGAQGSPVKKNTEVMAPNSNSQAYNQSF